MLSYFAGIITSKSHTLMETIVTGVETSVQRFLTHVDSVFTTLDTDLRCVRRSLLHTP